VGETLALIFSLSAKMGLGVSCASFVNHKKSVNASDYCIFIISKHLNEST
jgi:hypothetical protein